MRRNGCLNSQCTHFRSRLYFKIYRLPSDNTFAYLRLTDTERKNIFFGRNSLRQGTGRRIGAIVIEDFYGIQFYPPLSADNGKGHGA